MEFILFLLWGIRTGVSLLSATYYWQLKEYRWDRMREFLSTQQTASVFFSTQQLLMLFFLGGYLSLEFLMVINPLKNALVPLLGTLFLAEILQFLHQVWQRKAKRPRFTTKALLILGLSFILECVLLMFIYFIGEVGFSLHDLALYLGILALIDHDIHAVVILGVLNPVSMFFKKRMFHQAADKRKKFSQLKVVGITGSFGKTSVKEYLSHVLEGQFNVLKTEKNTNTEIGITQTILKNLQPHHEVFVCEMGAYKKGEIALCSQIARPDIAVFTGLNHQHVALFGSLDKTFAAKWELVSSLNEQGVAVFNGDCDALSDRLKSFRGKTILCKTKAENSKISHISVQSDGLSFEYKETHFESVLIGEFQIVNLVMVIEVAEQLGMSLEKISQRIRTIKAPEQTMQMRNFSKGVIIDDSYNVNSDGLTAALKHLETFENYQKIVFFPGVLELGEKSQMMHMEMGSELGKYVDYAFLTDKSFSEMISRGALQSGLTRAHIFEMSDTDEIIKQLDELFEEEKDAKWVLLFESRGSQKVMDSLMKH
ncbi:MAG: UDP-N-acetylmuramoyl-tripeptide--D-alanyl-D-alanine ligase [Candidatus Gracilibacteria bacterium]|nr:UDP-N-acetylmuramoyl-tripeptide--D-alanyl-D-alanine ligase [Candidatus Gracilibacteria bacterium]